MRINRERIEALRRQTGAERRRHAAVESELRRRAREGPRPGDIFLLAPTLELPVEWAVLDEEVDAAAGSPAGSAAPRRLLAVPADTHPLVGRADMAVPEEASCAPLTLRCGFGVWLDGGDFDPEMRTGWLPGDVLERARRKWSAVEDGRLQASAEEREIDDDPDYGAWVGEVLKPARAAVAGPPAAAPGGAAVVRHPSASTPWRSAGNLYALAASVLLMVSLGLGGGLVWQRQRISELEQAALRGQGNIPFERLDFSPEGTRSGEESLLLPASASEVFLFLNVLELSPDPDQRYRLEILRRDTREEVWRSGELTRVGVTSLTVALPTRLLPPGDYLFRLHDADDGAGEALAEVVLGLAYE